MVQFPSAVQLVVTKYCNWITGSDQEGPINLGLSVHASVALSVYFKFTQWFFLKLGMV